MAATGPVFLSVSRARWTAGETRVGLVRTRRSSQTIYYRVAGAEAPAVLATLHSIYCRDDKAEIAEFGKPIPLPEIQRPAA